MRLFHSLSVFLFCAAVSVVGFADDAVVLPSGYVQLDHVTFDSSAYVKTGLTPENGWKIAVDFEPKEVTTGGNHCLWCARKSATASTTAANFNFFYNVDGNPRFDFYDRCDSLLITISAERHLFVLDGQTLSIDGETIATAAMTEAFTAGGSLNLFGSSIGTAAPNTNWASGKFYGAKIWNGAGELVMNIVPCLKTADGSLAFYDAVEAKDLTKSGTFYSNDYKTWKPGVTSGNFTAATSWSDGQTPQDYDTIDFSTTDATVTFPAGETVFTGKFLMDPPSPTADETHEFTFNTTDGKSFCLYDGTTEWTHPIFRRWTFANNKWSLNANGVYLFKKGETGYAGQMKMSDAVVTVKLAPHETRIVQESGTLDWANGIEGQHVEFLGSANSVGVTNLVTYELKGGRAILNWPDFRANSRMIMSGGELVTSGPRLVPNNMASGNNFGGGHAEFIMTGGRVDVPYGGVIVGQYGGADAVFKMSGDAYFRKSWGGAVSGDTTPTFNIASDTTDNSGKGTALRGAATFSDNAYFEITGANNVYRQYGNLSVASSKNATGTLTAEDYARLIFSNGYAKFGSGENAKATVSLSGHAELRVLGKVTSKLTAVNEGVTVGGELSQESVLSIDDQALLETPRVCSVANTSSAFVRNALILNGGVLQTREIDGAGWLDVEINGGIIRASAASTAAKPLIGGLKSLTVADGAKVVIDTQDFDVYVNADFGAGVTVEKRGAGTLYVAGPSSHATTLVYAGAVEKTDDAFAFGEFIVAQAAVTWAATGPANWNAWSSWSPQGIVGGLTDVTVDSAAEMILQDGDAAKSLTVTANGSLTLSGSSDVVIGEAVTVTGDGSAKVWEAADGASVKIATPAFAATTTAFKKTGAGALAFDFNTIGTDIPFVAGVASGVRPINVEGGTLSILGKSCWELNGKLGVTSSGVDGALYVGNGATVVLERIGHGSSTGGAATYIGSSDDGDGTLVLQNGAIDLGTMSVGYRCTKPTVATLAVTNASVCASSGATVCFGDVQNDTQAATVTAVGRFGTGAVLADTGGGTSDGTVAFGAGCDVEFADGAQVTLTRTPTGEARIRGWIYSPSRASGSVRFVREGLMSFKGGLAVNNYDLKASDTKKFVYSFDGGIFKPTITTADSSRTDAYKECRYAIFKFPAYQGFEAGAGGMTVDMSECARYTIAAPVRGVGAIKKVGSGVLVLGTGRTFADGYTGVRGFNDNDVANTAKVVASGVVTVQNAGGVQVAEGTVEVEAGATGTNSCFTVASGCTVDLAGNTVELGMLKGEGVVSGGTIAQICFKPLADGESAATLENVAVQKGFVDLAGVAPGETVRIAKIGRGVTGAMAGASFRLKAVNAARGEKGAECAVDGDGNVTATAVASGLLVIFK